MITTCSRTGTVVGRIFKANAAPVGSPWMWTIAFGHHEDRSPTHGYEATRKDAMAASQVNSGQFRSGLRTCRSLGGKLKMR
jgi:hypothetical protein